MAEQSFTKKSFNSFSGLNLRDSDLVRSENYASEILNVEFRETGALNKRRGYHGKGRTEGGAGLAIYSEINTVNGSVDNQVIAISDTLSILRQKTITLSYSGTRLSRFTMRLDADLNAFVAEIFEDSDRVFFFNLGRGREEILTETVQSLIDNINALADYTMTADGITLTPACFIDITRSENLNEPLEIAYEYYEDVPSPNGAPFSNHWARRQEPDFEVASTANLNGVIYISNGYDELHKFDGVSVYRAGLPQPTALSGNITTGTLTGDFQYQITYEHTDDKENFVESDPSAPIAITLANEGYTLNIPTLRRDSGFNVDNVKINIWRTDDSSDIFFLIDTIDNNPDLASLSFTDADGALGAQFIELLQPAGLPPKGRYLTTYRNRLFITGVVDDVNNTFYSTLDSPEYFPPDDNAFLTDNTRGDVNTGIAPLGSVLYIFKERSIYALTGDIEQVRFRVDLVSRGDIGCVAHATIQEVNGSLMYLASNGIYSIAGVDREPVQVSEIIERIFETRSRTYNAKKAIAVNWLLEDKYIVCLPTETQDDGFVTETAELVVFDYFRQAWLLWDNIDASGGFAILNDDVYFTERAFDTEIATGRNLLYRISNTGDTFDYADHTESIEFLYATHWEALGEPSVFKKFLRLKVHSLDTVINDFETDGFLLTVNVENNYIRNNYTSQFDLDFGVNSVLGYGNQPWGLFPWGNSRALGLKSKLRRNKVRSQRILFRNDRIHENVLISGYELEVSTPYKTAIKE